MKKIFAMVLVASLLVAGCGKSDAENGKRKLVISTWGLSEDQLQKEVYQPFEEQFNCEIVIESGTTSQRYTKLANNPKNSMIDVIELSQAEAAKGYEANLFEKLDYSKIPNASQLIESAASLTQSGYGPAYTLNSIGIIYNKEAVGFEIKDWSDLWRAELKGKISIPEITSTFGPAMVHVASDYKGVDIKSDQGIAAFAALEELKPNIVKTYSKSSDLANMFSSGEIAVAVVGDFGVPVVQKVDPQATYVTPESGTYANFNTIDIVATSQNKDLAYEYINWRMSSEMQAKNANPATLNEAPTNQLVTLSEEFAKNKTYGEVAKKAKAIDYSFVNPLMSQWIDNWNRTINQ
ncbi:MAG: ABC transporter substrate-binding protein [Erysipelotrichaceae bacterium]|nr:ABC transporter substrate-binding protein [Erysipelotrichaceae bacterium]